jgi:type IV secretory pathway TraG/TraD family ATPase VirD4
VAAERGVAVAVSGNLLWIPHFAEPFSVRLIGKLLPSFYLSFWKHNVKYNIQVLPAKPIFHTYFQKILSAFFYFDSNFVREFKKENCERFWFWSAWGPSFGPLKMQKGGK